MLHQQSFSRFILFLRSVIPVLPLFALFGGATSGHAQTELALSYVTSIRIDCIADSYAKGIAGIYHEGRMLLPEKLLVACEKGMVATYDIRTEVEPDAWSVEEYQVYSPSDRFVCKFEAGTRFPALSACGVGNTQAHTMFFRPRLMDTRDDGTK